MNDDSLGPELPNILVPQDRLVEFCRRHHISGRWRFSSRFCARASALRATSTFWRLKQRPWNSGIDAPRFTCQGRRLQFREPVRDPLRLGPSGSFGLGLFRPVVENAKEC